MTRIKNSLNASYTLWFREMIKFWRSKAQVIGSLLTPFSFIVFLGPGISSAFQFKEGGFVNISFFAPGFIGMVILFASLFSGSSIIWDREFGILKEVLIAPVGRFSVALGKTLGGVTIGMIQGTLFLFVIMLIGVKYTSILGVFTSLLFMFLIGMGFTGLAIALASKIDNLNGFQMVMSFFAMPLVLLSGAFFPIADLPYWLKGLVYVNPLTYGVEGLRWCLSGTSTIPISWSIVVSSIFGIVMVAIAGKLFGKMKV